MNVVLKWLRTNVYIVICVAAMIVVPVVLWFFSRGMNAEVRELVEERASKISELAQLERTSVSFHSPVPGNPQVQETIAVNQQFLDRYQEVVEEVRQDVSRVRETVLAMNRQGRGVLLPVLFPQPPMEQVETLPREMYEALYAATRRLLEEIDAGTPPSVETMQEELVAARERYKTQMLMKKAQLTEEEQAWLTEQLTKTRLSYYADAARDMSVYADLGALYLPAEDDIPASAEGEGLIRMFDWQWRHWIRQDVLRALAKANEPYDSVVDAPVKRLVSLAVLDAPGQTRAPAPTTAGGGGGGGASGSGMSMGMSAGMSSGRRPRGTGGGDAPQAAPPDPSREVQPDYSISFTGRETNPLFDVRRVSLVLVVDSARIPEVFDALARQNFVTVLDVQVENVDLFSAIEGGHFYGNAPVSRLTLELETIWLREWTREFMPVGLKQMLGIPVESETKES